MPDVLSQNEIDALLNALKSGEVDIDEMENESNEKKIKPYDFRSSNKFTKEQIRTLYVIHESFGRLISSYFSGIFRTYCQVDVASIEEQAYYEFTNSIPDPTILAISGFQPLQGSMLIEISPSIANSMIDRLLGGAGKNSGPIRNFTEIEIVLMDKIIRQMLISLRDSWANVLNIQPELQRIETSSQFIQFVAPNETIVIVTLNITMKDTTGIVNFCIPYVTLEPVSKQLNTKYWFSTKTSNKKDGYPLKAIQSHIEGALLEVKGILGETTLLLQDIMDLQVGDVIPLDQKVTDEIKIFIENSIRFYGTFGSRKKNLAIKITQVMKDEVLEDE